jgi:hypothetical protein
MCALDHVHHPDEGEEKPSDSWTSSATGETSVRSLPASTTAASGPCICPGLSPGSAFLLPVISLPRFGSANMREVVEVVELCFVTRSPFLNPSTEENASLVEVTRRRIARPGLGSCSCILYGLCRRDQW